MYTALNCLVTAILISCMSISHLFAADKPNIIFLLVDDLGWTDVGFMGSNYYETPNIDTLSKKSMVFTSAYAAAALCSPTRASIQTGKYPARLGITDWIRARFQLPDGVYPTPPAYAENENKSLRTPSNPYWMELEEVTIAELLQQSGYFTCHIGKWHLGPDPYYPEEQGYDQNIGGNDMGNPSNYFDPYANDKGITFPNLASRKEGEYLVDRLTDEMVEVIKENKDKPFFINMCYYAVHVPLMGKQNLVDKYQAKQGDGQQRVPKYAAMVESVDQSVGKLVHILKQEKLLDNTIIIFFSDNGGLIKVTGNEPLRAGKGYPYEGGIREPLFIYWKEKIQPGSKSDVPVASIDFLPTLCAITQTPLPDTKIDGHDISPLFRGDTIKQVPLFWHYPHYRGGGDMVLGEEVPYSIVRDGDWKLIKRYEGKQFELFNLKNDLGETTDLSEKYPDVVARLNKKLEEWLRSTNAKLPIKK